MGLGTGANAFTSGGLLMGTLMLIIMGIFLISASNKIQELPGFSKSKELNAVNENIKTAYFLVFVSAFIYFLISIAYGGHEVAWCPSEMWHGVFATIAMIILIIAFVYIYFALSDLYHPEIEERNGADVYMWASFLIGAFAFLTLGAIGSARVGYAAVKSEGSKRLNIVERKIHEAHSAITGQPLEYKEPKDSCSCEQECPQEKVTYHTQEPTYHTQVPHATYQAPHSITMSSQPSSIVVPLNKSLISAQSVQSVQVPSQTIKLPSQFPSQLPSQTIKLPSQTMPSSSFENMQSLGRSSEFV